MRKYERPQLKEEQLVIECIMDESNGGVKLGGSADANPTPDSIFNIFNGGTN